MGRYYNGDIEGKFWVAVQSSNAADQFGVEGTAPEQLEYGFYESHHIPSVKDTASRRSRIDWTTTRFTDSLKVKVPDGITKMT
jgi:hypothetical protein